MPTSDPARHSRTVNRIKNLVNDYNARRQEPISAAVVEAAPPYLPRASPSEPEVGAVVQIDPISKKILDYSADNIANHEKYLATQIRLTNLLRKLYHPEVTIQSMGSTGAGFGNRTSDYDFCFMSPDLTNDNRNECARKLRNKLLRQKRGDFIQDAFYVANRKLALVHITLTDLTPVDLVLGNVVGIRNTKMLSAFNRFDGRVRPIVVVTKKWAKRVKIVDSKKGGLNAYAFTLLVINYFQNIKILPALNDPRWHINFDGDLTKLWKDVGNFGNEVAPLKTDISIMDILTGFLKYLGHFDFATQTICIRSGSIIPKQKQSIIWLSEPFDSEDNCARTAAGHIPKLIKNESKKLWKQIVEENGLENLLDS